MKKSEGNYFLYNRNNIGMLLDCKSLKNDYYQQSNNPLIIPYKCLYAPNVTNIDYVQILDWGNKNIIGILTSSKLFLIKFSKPYEIKLPLTLMQNQSKLTSIKWNPEFLLAIGNKNGEITILDTKNISIVNTPRKVHKGQVTSIIWKDHNIYSSSGLDQTIKLFDIRIRNPICKIKNHNGCITCHKWSVDNNLLASGGLDHLLMLWDFRNHQVLSSFETKIGVLKRLTWSPFNSEIFASCSSGITSNLSIYNTNTNNIISSLNIDKKIQGITWNPELNELISFNGEPDNAIEIWSSPELNSKFIKSIHADEIMDISISPDRTELVSIGKDDKLFYSSINSHLAEISKKSYELSLISSKLNSHIR